MLIINKIQKSIYDCLTSQKDDDFKQIKGIFNYIEKNEPFPYIFTHVDRVNNLSTFNKDIYSCLIILNIYDKNTTNSYVINLSDKIKNLFLKLSNFSFVNYEILDIKFNNFSINLENDGKVWNGELNFEFIVN